MKALFYFTATFTALLVGGLTYLVLLLFTAEFNPLLWPLLPKVILAFDCGVVFYKVMRDEDTLFGMPKMENPPPPPPPPSRKDPRPTLEERDRTKGNINEGEPTIPRERVPAPPPAKPRTT